MPVKIICKNRKAFHEYFIEETYEAGVVLKGTEVKSLRAGKANLVDSYAVFRGEELYLLNSHINPYTHASRDNHDPTRSRKLLLHKKELDRLSGKIKERGLSLVPLKLYFKESKAKVEIALVKGKKLYDKREDIKKRTIDRALKRTLMVRQRQ